MREGDRGEVGREDGGAAICVDPEKERHQRAGSPEHHRYFNPRSREGATPFTTNFLSPTYNILSHFAQIVLFKIFKSASINAPLTHFVTFFDASLQTFLCTLSTRTEHVLHNQHLISSCAAVYAYMLDFRLVFISQIIKSQAVHLSIYNIRQNGF